MSKTMYFAVAICLGALSPLCEAQFGSGREVSPVIYVPAAEAETAKQVMAALKGAQERKERAETAWQSFQQTYQAAHPELPNLQFSSDFRIAFVRRDASTRYPLNQVAASVELSSEERQKAESAHREMVEARAALEKAQIAWADYWYQFVADHVRDSTARGGNLVKTSAGKEIVLPNPWTSGVVFSADCRLAVPR